MEWKEIRDKYHDQWLVIEALEAYSANDLRCVERIAVIATCVEGSHAFQTYQNIHHQYPEREFYFVHTSRADLQIEERRWIGIRGLHSHHAVDTG